MASALAACSTLDAARTAWAAERVQEPGEGAPPGEEAPEAGEHEPWHHASVFVGDTIVSGDHALTLGLDYEYRLQEHFGIGGIVDFAFDGVARDTILAVSFLLHPVERVAILAAPGIELADGESFFLFRTGLSYEFPVGEKFTIGPAVYVDFLEGGEQATVLGVGFGIEF